MYILSFLAYAFTYPPTCSQLTCRGQCAIIIVENLVSTKVIGIKLVLMVHLDAKFSNEHMSLDQQD